MFIKNRPSRSYGLFSIGSIDAKSGISDTADLYTTVTPITHYTLHYNGCRVMWLAPTIIVAYCGAPLKPL
jgi:hypothetical protein